MSLQGGMTKHNNIRPFYMELLEMIDDLPQIVERASQQTHKRKGSAENSADPYFDLKRSVL